jgi:hypothetical protein
MSELRDVVIPAGGQIGADYAHLIGTPYRALAPLGPDRIATMQVIVDALRASGAVRRIIGIAAEAVAKRITNVDVWLPAGPGGPENILNGLAALESPETPAIVCTSDLPLLTPEAVRAFVSACRPEADVTLGLVSAAAYEAAFPGAPTSQWVQLRDVGPVTLGGVFQIRPALLLRNSARLTQAMDARKSQFRMIRLLGPSLICQWAANALTLRSLKARGEALLGGQVQVLRNLPPVLSFDIDTEDDYTYADTCIQEQRSPGASRPCSVPL